MENTSIEYIRKHVQFRDAFGNIHSFPEDRTVEDIAWRLSAYGRCMDEQGKVLFITEDRFSTWSLPGGGVDIGESATEGLHREFLEETGFAITLRKPMPIYLGTSAFYRTSKDQFYWNQYMVFDVAIDATIPRNEELFETFETDEMQWIGQTDPEAQHIHHLFTTIYDA